MLGADALMTRAEIEAVRAAVVRGEEESSTGYFGGRGPFRWAEVDESAQKRTFCTFSPGIVSSHANYTNSTNTPLPRNPELSVRTQTGSPLVAAAAALARSQCELDIRGERGRFGPLSPEMANFSGTFSVPSTFSNSGASAQLPSGNQIAGAAQALMRQKVAFPAAEAFVRRAHELAGLLVPGALSELIRAGVPVSHPLPGDVVVQRGGPFVDVGISLGDLVYVSAKTGFPELYRFWPDRGSARRFWV